MPRHPRTPLALALGATLAGAALPAHAEPPRPEAKVVGQDDSFTPAGFTARVRAHASLIAASDVPTDRDGAVFALDPTLDSQIRVRADYRHDWVRGNVAHTSLRLAFEQDLASGVLLGGPADFEGIDAPYMADRVDHQLRVASATLAIGTDLRLALGAMTSHWGLGLLANDGAHGWAPGSARFSDPRGGDRVLRALVATGPHLDSGLVAFAAIDEVLGDDVLIGDDEAWQAVAGFTLGDPKRGLHGGLYGVYRIQEAVDGDRTEIGVADLYARAGGTWSGLEVAAELEAALIFGSTDLAPTADHPTHDVLQAGAALRLTLDACMGGAALDVLFASGDAAWDDDTQSGFKADRNFDVGLLLNDVVLAALTARTPIRAADPELIGVPSEDLDRLPTRGSATNTLTFFPRGYFRPTNGVELYGGLLLALSASDESDAFNARLEGGAPTNALGGRSSTLIATELDLGARFSGLFWGTRLTFGLEGGVLLPGPGLTGPDGLGEDPIWGGRALVTYEL